MERKRRFSALAAVLLLVTWCAGCPEETPDSAAFAKQAKGQDTAGDLGANADTHAASDTDTLADADALPDAGQPDTGGTDTAQPDTGLTDTALTDTATNDAGATDTGSTGTGSTDTGVADTGVADTGVADTGVADTGPTDTGAADTATEQDTATITKDAGCTSSAQCPKPSSACQFAACKAGACTVESMKDHSVCGKHQYCLAGACKTKWAIAVSAGYHSTCAVQASGEVQCWGSNSKGLLGNGKPGSLPTSSKPVAVSGLKGAVAVDVGNGHACAVTANDEAWCWGKGSTWALGNGSDKDAWTPVKVSLNKASAVGSGANHACALSSATPYCWGSSGHKQAGSSASTQKGANKIGINAVSALAVGGDNTCVLKAGEVRCWGANLEGQLATGKKGFYESSATPLKVLLPSKALHVAVGNGTICALIEGGQVRCWGEGDVGELGNGLKSGSTTAVHVIGVAGATALDVGDDHGCVVQLSGQVWCWGRGVEGQLGLPKDQGNQTKPVQVAGVDGAVAVTTGGYHTCALGKTGEVQCWGAGTDGQLGGGQAVSTHKPVTVVGSK